MSGETHVVPRAMSDRYTNLIDWKFFEAMGVTIEQAPLCPWQFFISHPDLNGKIAYYPSTGSMVREEYQGEFAKLGKAADSEEAVEKVYQVINGI